MGRTPRIVRSTRRRVVKVEPPPYEEHEWGPATDDGQEKVLIEMRCVKELVEHCMAQSERGIEAMGFLAGGVFSWEGSPYAVARDAVTTDLEASSVSVRFDRGGFGDLFSNLDRLGYDYILVGWYHSHPGYGCFMSSTDLDTQSRGFNEAHQFALVVDPVKRMMKAFKVEGKGCREVGVGIYSEEEWPWPLMRTGR